MSKRLDGIRSMLRDSEAQTAPNNHARGWRADCEYLLAVVDELQAELDEALPHLRALARHCEACEGYGAIVRGESDEKAWEEPCGYCKPLQDQIQRLTPKLPPAPEVIPVEEVEENDIPF